MAIRLDEIYDAGDRLLVIAHATAEKPAAVFGSAVRSSPFTRFVAAGACFNDRDEARETAGVRP
jgi:hypothetical protein